MAFLAPINTQDQPPEPGVNAGMFDRLMGAFSAPGTDALMGGPWGALANVRHVFNPLLRAAWEKGEKLSKLNKAMQETPEVFGFKSAHEWRKSLPQEDAFALFMHDQTPYQVGKTAANEAGYMERITPPTEEELGMIKAREMFPPGESLSTNALGLSRTEMLKRRQN